jgi:transitional endoplasmic reticulum ATPase
MDDQTLASLKAALEASPENTKLFAVVVRALLDRGDSAEARRLVGAAPVDRFSGDDRLLVARVYQRTGEPERALPFADADDPEALIVRARVLADLGRRDEAKRAYERAVDRNPTTEDMSLRALIEARSVEAPDGSRRLKVISNDDTDATEVARLLVPATGKVTFSDVGGLDEVKKHITRKIILPFTKPSIFERFKKRPGGGILMYGPPGCGKTLLARATAGECKAQFFNVAIADVLDMYIGESERKLHAIFDKARSSAPAILFFDELEALAGKRQFSREGTSSKLVSQFLSEMDGFSQNNTPFCRWYSWIASVLPRRFTRPAPRPLSDPKAGSRTELWGTP